jgi:Holliday junction resolvase RusA-like endonuclease
VNAEIDIWVPGVPQPGGSKRGFYNPKLGRAQVVDANDAKVKPWRACVSQAAADAVSAVLEGPLRVRFDFVYTRPKGHYGSGKNAGILKRNAPPFPAVKPDTTKLVRPAEDALKGILWKDDSQIVTQAATKRYGEQAGCRIRVAQEKA